MIVQLTGRSRLAFADCPSASERATSTLTFIELRRELVTITPLSGGTSA